MHITLNNEQLIIQHDTTLADLLSQNTVDTTFAIAVNLEFIPRSAYADTYLHDNDIVELLIPMQGG